MPKWDFLLESDASYRRALRKWKASNDPHDFERVESEFLKSSDGPDNFYDRDSTKLKRMAKDVGLNVAFRYTSLVASDATGWMHGAIYFNVPITSYSRNTWIVMYYPTARVALINKVLPYIYVSSGLNTALDNKLIPLLHRAFPGRRLE